MQDTYWEHFDHGADIGIRGVAPSLSKAFEQTAMAMTAAVTDPNCVAAEKTISIQCSSSDVEILLLDWLNSVIYEMATNSMLFGDFTVTIENDRLTASARGETVNVEKHQPATEIKGATFTELKVTRLDNGLWLAQCVVDV